MTRTGVRTMHRVALIFNPAAGQRSKAVRSVVERIASVLASTGVQTHTYCTQGAGSAGPLTLQAIAEGCEAVFACGGDGTVHEVLQSIVGTQTPLGVIPLGTANALAANLGLRGKPERIANMLLNATPTMIPVGRITTSDRSGEPQSRYFIVAGGVGADALLLSRMDTRRKRRWGYLLYLWEGMHVWARYRFPSFECEFVDGKSGESRKFLASQLLAVRIRNFGGAMGSLAPGATIHGEELRLLAFKTRRRADYFRFLVPVLLGRKSLVPSIELHDAVHVECRSVEEWRENIMAEADGEVLGELPVKFEVVPNALRLLIPEGARP